MPGGLSPATAAKPMLSVSSEGIYPCSCAQRGAEDHCALGWGQAYPSRTVSPWVGASPGTCTDLQKNIPICLFEPPLLERQAPGLARWVHQQKGPPRCLWAAQNRSISWRGPMSLHKTASCEVTNSPWETHRSPAWPSATCTLQRVNTSLAFTTRAVPALSLP